MIVEVLAHPSGSRIYTVRSAENEFQLSSFGGQLLSWNKGGVPILFANEAAAVQDGRTAYRGGAPICFPHFSKGHFLPSNTPVEPQHGRSRTSQWDVEVREDDQALVFRTEQPSSEGFGPTTFGCEVAYVFTDDLAIHAKVSNLGERPAPFQFVVHSYWATQDPGRAVVAGLGERYFDNREGLAERLDPDSGKAHTPPFDRVYPDAADEMEVRTEVYCLAIKTHGCAGAVLWNPGNDHGIRDLQSPDFVCVESGIVTPSHLAQPGEERLVSVAYRAEILG
jgi:glucose-6-phosphate 1-epimerase